MNFNGLTPEQIERAKSCASADELASLAKEEGLELTDEQLEAIAGGDWDSPICGDFWDCEYFSTILAG